jgi:hypothetical protein
MGAAVAAPLGVMVVVAVAVTSVAVTRVLVAAVAAPRRAKVIDVLPGSVRM